MPPRRYVCCLGLALTALTGCAQSGPLISKGTGVGTLKTSLSHMEYENQQLRREVASLKAEIRQTEDRLVQEESANGELSTRLDNATALLKRRGYPEGDMAQSNSSEPDPERPKTTLPAGRSNRKPRKPPFAQIPGRLDLLPPETERNSHPAGGWEDDPTTGSNTGRGPQSRLDSPVVWLPVARGATAPSASPTLR